METLNALFVGLLLTSLAGCGRPSTGAVRVDVGAETKAIQALEDSWSEHWEAGDLETLVDAYYSPDAILAASAPDHRGREAILLKYRALKADRNLVLDYRPAELTVAASGDLAVRSGTFANRYTDPVTHQAANDAGRYVVGYRKQIAAWRATFDIETSQSP